MPWPGDRQAAAAASGARINSPARPEFFWLSDGIEDGQGKSAARRAGNAMAVAQHLRARSAGARACCRRARDATGFRRHRDPRECRQSGQHSRSRPSARSGETLSDATFAFKGGPGSRRRAISPCRWKCATRPRGLQIQGEDSAGAVQLLDSGGDRAAGAGIVSAAATEKAQPLLSDVYYLERALAPFAEIEKGTISRSDCPACLGAVSGRCRQDHRQRCRRGGQVR